jgi:Sulfotransferase family
MSARLRPTAIPVAWRLARAASRAVWPNLFLVGAAKAGTTSVYDELGRHPAIFMSPMKEPNFFSRIEPAGEREAFFPHVSDEAAYLALFEGATDERVAGEGSTSYLWEPQAAERIKRAAPGASVLVMLRDPVERAYSSYWNDVREGIERRSFAEAVEEERRRSRPGAWGVTSLYIDCGLYASQVERYLDAFGGRVLVSFFEDYVADREAAMARIFSFLGVGPAGAPPEGRRMNPASLPRNALSRAILASGRLRTLARATLPRALRSRMRGSMLKEASPPPMDAATRESLGALFRSDVERLAQLLGVDPPWPAQAPGDQPAVTSASSRAL